MIILDSNVVSELMRPAPAEAVLRWVGAQDPAALCTTSITVAEVRYGIARFPAGRRRDALRDAAEGVFSDFAERVYPFDVLAARHYADIVVERELAGRPISGFDALIAAICRGAGAALATRNTDDFAGLGVDLRDPWATER